MDFIFKRDVEGIWKYGENAGLRDPSPNPFLYAMACLTLSIPLMESILFALNNAVLRWSHIEKTNFHTCLDRSVAHRFPE